MRHGIELVKKTYPIQKKSLTVEYLRDNAHLRARTDPISSMLRLRADVLRSLHHYFDVRMTSLYSHLCDSLYGLGQGQGFCYTHTPILTSNDCEGAGEAFRIAPIPPDSSSSTSKGPDEFFSQPSYLTVSSQLHLEALASSISRVYTISPCFRAEKSQTNRHLAEFWMLEAEWAFVEDVGEICDVVEGAIKDVISQSGPAALLENVAGEKKWARMSYGEAIQHLSKHHESSSTQEGFAFAPSWGKPLQSEHERWLADHFVGGPVFITDYPASLKPFYMRLNSDNETVACFDLLVPRLGELVGGSLREERLDFLERALDKHGLSREEYGWYLDLRKFGGAPHGGFGMGFERLVGWLSGVENVRECIPMPRWAGRMLL